MKLKTIEVTESPLVASRLVVYGGLHDSSSSSAGRSCSFLTSRGAAPARAMTSAVDAPSLNSRYVPGSAAARGHEDAATITASITKKAHRPITPAGCRCDWPVRLLRDARRDRCCVF